MAAQFEDVDKGWNAIKRNIKRMPGEISVVAGVQGSAATESRATDAGAEITNAILMLIHEFGLGVPERSVLRATVDREVKKYQRFLDRVAAKMVSPTRADIKTELEKLGLIVVADMVKTIDRSIGLKELSEKTIARKGSSKPLIDTGILKGAITHTVEEGKIPTSPQRTP